MTDILQRIRTSLYVYHQFKADKHKANTNMNMHQIDNRWNSV